MNKIIPVVWSPEWYEFVTTEELVTLLEEGRTMVIARGKQASQSKVWKERIERIENELARRRDSFDE